MLKNCFRVFVVPLFQDNYSYIVQTSLKQPLMLVDPADPEVILDCLARYFKDQQVGHILYTHRHWDHAGGAVELYKKLNENEDSLQVYCGAEDAIHITTVSHQVQSDEEIKMGETNVRIYKVPCHTRGHVIYHFRDSKNGLAPCGLYKQQLETSAGKIIRIFEEKQCVFTGDTLFCGGIGKFFEGSANEMYNNLRKINQNIDNNCSIFNGHEYTLQNLKWSIGVDPKNLEIQQMIKKLEGEGESQCTLPTTLARESKINLFYQAGIAHQNKLGVQGVEYLRILRAAKNNDSTRLEDFV